MPKIHIACPGYSTYHFLSLLQRMPMQLPKRPVCPLLPAELNSTFPQEKVRVDYT